MKDRDTPLVVGFLVVMAMSVLVVIGLVAGLSGYLGPNDGVIGMPSECNRSI